MSTRVSGRTAIAIDSVLKRYEDLTALQHVSFEVPSGTAVGLVGPNGAGKSTLLRLIGGLSRPDAGRVVVAGADPFRQPALAKARLGYLPDVPPLFELLSGSEQLTWCGRLHGLSDGVIADRMRELCDVLDLSSALPRRVATYSRGMRQKLAFVATILHDPRILVLDEPFDGVDVLAVRSMKAIVRQFVRAGAGVLLSSHNLPLVEDVCDAFVVLLAGTVAFAGDHAALAREAAQLGGAQPDDGRRLEPVFWQVVAPDHLPCSLTTVAQVHAEDPHADFDR